MDEPLEVLVTNDDGIESSGLHAVVDSLSSFADVTVVAPAEDQSAVGRAISNRVTVADHDLGYAVAGTPADCVVAGVGELVSDPDLLVAGCNRGANLGTYTLGRSGTVSAAVEASFFDIPAIAVSLYVPTGSEGYEDRSITETDYEVATAALEHLVLNLPEALFDRIDYLNVNAPVPDDEPTAMEVTRPSETYDMDATRDVDTVTFHDKIWDRMADGTVEEPPGTDRRAILEGNVSVSPLSVPHEHTRATDLDDLVVSF